MFLYLKMTPPKRIKILNDPLAKWLPPPPLTGKKRTVSYKKVTGNALIKKVQ